MPTCMCMPMCMCMCMPMCMCMCTCKAFYLPEARATRRSNVRPMHVHARASVDTIPSRAPHAWCMQVLDETLLNQHVTTERDTVDTTRWEFWPSCAELSVSTHDQLPLAVMTTCGWSW